MRQERGISPLHLPPDRGKSLLPDWRQDPLEGEMPVPQQYEYKFVRLGEGIMEVRKAGKEGYQDAIHKHAAKGWRLVQVFAPGVGAYGAAKYYELIFERPVA